jgi:hypothetical protein
MSGEYTEAEFVVDGLNEKFAGYTNGQTWNGFACPAFEEDEADKIIAALTEPDPGSGNGSGKIFSKSADSIIIFEEEYPEEPLVFNCELIETLTGTKRVFALGSHVWTWQQCEPQVNRFRERSENG